MGKSEPDRRELIAQASGVRLIGKFWSGKADDSRPLPFDMPVDLRIMIA
ncbi:MAG: hypothetical protein J2P53_03655 [Bradyrhizobiaceae bacterium]|nr:hypothetical protein [Bradyrhizobiaceae bacterium]